MHIHLVGTVQSSTWGGQPNPGLQVRAEGQQAAIAILDHEFTQVPWHVGKSAGEIHAASGIPSVKRVRIFDEYVGVEQFVRIFVGVGGGRFGAAEVNRLLLCLSPLGAGPF